MTALLLLTLATGLAAAPPDIPKTPAGARFEQWLTAFNSGDKAKIHAFHVDAMPPGEASDDRAEMVLGFHRDTGGFDLVSVSSPDPTHLTALLKERNSDRRARLEMEVEGATPYKVANIELRPDGPPPQREAPPARVSESGSARRPQSRSRKAG